MLVVQALALPAMAAQSPPPSYDFDWATVTNAGIEASMSRPGNCCDNAVVESFWGKLKGEMVHHERFATESQASAAVLEYIEVFYNRKRPHAALGYLSPEQFEAR